MRFFSDNAAAACPEVMAAIAAANRLDTAYDGDAWSRRLNGAFSDLFGTEVEALWVATATSLPILTVALVVGVVIGLVQALTSIQEMTLTFVPKAAAILAVFWVSMGFMTTTLSDFFAHRIVPLIAGI